jgi:spermidine synthase
LHPVLYLLFLLSGATALVYQVVWVRQLSLVFGGSHLAVSTVLAVFMGGLALGGWLLGRRADGWSRPLRAYGFLEVGIALSALAFHGALQAYPALYVPVARPFLESPPALTAIRFLFAALGMIVPTTLMGATLPVLSRFARSAGAGLAGHLSFLYGINTLGAVAGAVAGGFLLLPGLGVSRALFTAVGVTLLVGGVAVVLGGRRVSELPEAGPADARSAIAGERALPERAGRWILLGIGVSGFCALGYEVLWTRTLGTALGTSTYAFTVMLAAFLAGIGLGSEAFGAFMRARGWRLTSRDLVLGFAGVQASIGLSALAVTWLLGDLPARGAWLQNLLVVAGAEEFGARQGANFVAAFSYMFVPAFLMGVAFPLAGTLHAVRRGRISGAVGEVLAWNTVGAILGALVAGFVLIRLFGVERALQVLAALNLALAACVAGALGRSAALRRAALGAAVLLIAVPPALPDRARMWNPDLIAIYRNNQRAAFDSPEKIRDALANTEILFFHEGVHSTISVIRPRAADQAVLVNGKVVASTSLEDLQCQYTLGHLPMLLHPNPRRVFVLGLGTGMTLGAVSLHPGVERIVLAEIEPAVEPAARTFAAWNHGVLDDPRLETAFTDGRNWLLTTRERFDVITADPVHPWTRGSAYLYTAEYYRLAADRLSPGGVMMQWLPIYELSPRDLATVVRTFRTVFPHTQVWLTHYDAHLVGSDAPLRLDETQLAARLAHPPIRRALGQVEMGTVEDLLSYFVLGDGGSEAFSRLGTTNTDDNLYLEFSAPRSTAVAGRMGENVEALARFREGPEKELAARSDSPAAEADASHQVRLRSGQIYDRLHALFLNGLHAHPEFALLADHLRRSDPGYAPFRFLERMLSREAERAPRPLETVGFPVLGPDGRPGVLEITAVTMRTGHGRAALMFVDNAAREIYGEIYVEAEREAALDEAIAATSEEVLRALEGRWRELAAAAPTGRPRLDALRARFRSDVESRLARPGPSGSGDEAAKAP